MIDLGAATVDLDRLAQLMKALAEPKRLRIVNLLMEGVQCNCELSDLLGVAPNMISHHLRVLREIGLVDIEHDIVDARWIYYSLNQPLLEELVQIFGAFFDPTRVKERHPSCGPQSTFVSVNEILESVR